MILPFLQERLHFSTLCGTIRGEKQLCRKKEAFAVQEPFMTREERERLARSYLGRVVHIGIDRPVGYVHHKEQYDLIYPINYGYIPGVLGGDAEELDVYLLGVDEPVEEYDAEIIGVVWREDDVEDKLVGAPRGMRYTADEVARAVEFQELHHVSLVEVL